MLKALCRRSLNSATASKYSKYKTQALVLRPCGRPTAGHGEKLASQIS